MLYKVFQSSSPGGATHSHWQVS